MRSVLQKVLIGVHAGRGDVRVGHQAVLPIEGSRVDLGGGTARGPDRPSLADTVLYKMLQRIDTGPGDIGIVDQVVFGVELGGGIATLLPAILVVMEKRISARGLHIRVGSKVTGGVEVCVRIAPFVPAILGEMRRGVYPGVIHIEIVAVII